MHTRLQTGFALALLGASLSCTSALWQDPGQEGSSPQEQERGSLYQEAPQFGGPSSTPAQIVEDNKQVEPVFRFTNLQEFLKPYYDFKEQLAAEQGIAFGLEYSVLYQRLNETLPAGQDDAAGGIFKLYGTWALVGRESGNTGTLVAKVENRKTLGTDVAPQSLGFEAGYLGLTGTQFSDFGWGVTNLYWNQKIAGGEAAILVGQIDVTDFFDVYGMVNPLTAFMNFDFLYPTAATPDQGLGIGAGAYLTENVYALASLADANGKPTEAGFDTFFEDREYFTSAELGWTSSRDRIYLDNVHLTAWHSDDRKAAGVPESWGVLFSGAYFVEDAWMPFLRAGLSAGEAPLLNASVAAGIGHYVRERSDLIGLGVSWGAPSTSGLSDQYSAELFYRVQLSPNFAITPDLQILVNPANNPFDDTVVVFGVRGRLTL